jgi:hypothetical protein
MTWQDRLGTKRGKVFSSKRQIKNEVAFRTLHHLHATSIRSVDHFVELGPVIEALVQQLQEQRRRARLFCVSAGAP